MTKYQENELIKLLKNITENKHHVGAIINRPYSHQWYTGR